MAHRSHVGPDHGISIVPMCNPNLQQSGEAVKHMRSNKVLGSVRLRCACTEFTADGPFLEVLERMLRVHPREARSLFDAVRENELFDWQPQT